MIVLKEKVKIYFGNYLSVLQKMADGFPKTRQYTNIFYLETMHFRRQTFFVSELP